ncbi:MAG: hypothetical protein C0602_10430 [Denitrovibrio sp.]|nr:MAG: hypothetical protein C0602_10430 [Denitrovibrio sp.]
MKIIINTSTLYFGGGVQVALSFINEIKDIPGNEYHVLLSQEIDRQLDSSMFPDNFYFYLIETSPAKFITRKKIIRQLDEIEEKVNPDAVFTVFGPSYWKPKSIHLLGFADGWVYNPTSIAFDRLSFFKKIRIRLLIKYKLYHLRTDADYYVLETNDASDKLRNIMKEAKDRFFVVGNTVSQVFDNKVYADKDNEFYIKLPEKKYDEFRLLYIAHNHPAKNLTLLNDVLKRLSGYNLKIILTIDEESYGKIFDDEVKLNVINVGSVPQLSCPSLYEQADAVISTTLLETFSAVYPEAMKMKKPLLSSDFSFARDICGESAVYFDALNPEDTVDKIIMLMTNKSLQEKLVQEVEKQLKTFETPNSRANKYLNILNKIKDDGNVQK